MLLFSSVSFYLGLILLLSSFYCLEESIFFYGEMKTLFLEWEFFSIFGSVLIMTFLIDWMSLVFMGLVMLISAMVLFYSANYMVGEKFIYRFNLLVFLFVISMLLLILSPNLISILLGWDGLGLVSYCLVIFYQNEKSANAGMITILSNRVGDVAVLLSIAWLVNFGSWNFYFIQLIKSNFLLGFILFMVVLAAMTKSAQIPFSAWLPAAMAAPTPVSSLVHSSTLVTAGVYLLIRFSNLLQVSNFLFLVGSLTMFMSGLGANFETDLKKIIALSTLSQLGVMMMTLSLGFYELSFFHLLSHALFKSLLFLCAGVFIHGMGDVQDVRHMGGIHTGFPISSLYFLGCSLSLCGFPFLSGFYSKDVILEIFFLGKMNFIMLAMILGGTLFTVTYSIRLGFYLFFKNLGLKSFSSFNEENLMILPMSLLFIFALLGGSMMVWLYFPGYFILLPKTFKLLIFSLVAGILFFLFLGLNFFKLTYLEVLASKFYFMGGMWFLPYFSSSLLTSFLSLGKFFIKFLDQGWAEYLGGQGSLKVLSKKFSLVDYFLILSMKIYFFIFFILTVYFISV